ncbi:hypothetical protein HUG17_9366 [Dermatophagoides farinae]|uniref:Uncharacterized protein n=1 Tax=Dermatophagoides farinae TaxID=6954 RepID=A0A9D4SEN6_DERFA|nr:uncharacterized protein LOC124496896 [Dermatophagoides farinae]KAH7638260.1 hypothetical protein HUG17_9366 [Dermatophagoides farinae]
MKIHNPYLRIFVLLHGTSGIQLLPIRRNDWHSIISFIINITLNVITYWAIFIDSPAGDENKWSDSSSAKLYDYFRRANFYAIYPIIYAGSIGSYLAYGHCIIASLDSTAFIIVRDCKQNRWKSLLIFLLGMIFWNQRFIIRELRYLIKLSLNNFRTLKLLTGMYLYHATQLTNWYLLCYYQLNIFFTLKQISHKLWSNESMQRTNSFSLEQRLYRSIIQLSEQCRHLQYYYSFIILFILIELSDSIIGNLCYLMIESFGTKIGWLSIYEQCVRWCLLIALVEMNHRNLILFDRIDQHFYRKLSTTIQMMINTNCSHVQYDRIARFSKFNQLNIYRQYYQLSLFNWLNVNISLLIDVFFFSLAYVLIISQTTTN